MSQLAPLDPGPLPRSGDERFFAELPELHVFAEVTHPRFYHSAPPSWRVVVTDVRGSTRAIEAGRYKDVNALGVASIVALRNALSDVEIPFVFGGDGATLLVPESAGPRVEVALRGLQEMARDAFSLELRTGIVPIADLVSAGHPVRVARYRTSPSVCLAMFAGRGFSVAERWVKDPAHADRYAVPAGEAHANLEGFECRWQPVLSRRGQVVSLLVLALGDSDEDRARTYGRVLGRLDALADTAATRPVSARGLRLGTPFSDYSTEARVRAGKASGAEYEAARKKARKGSVIGAVLIGLNASAGGFDGRAYLHELVENTDFRKFDETLRMVLDLSASDIGALHAFLEEEQRAGRLAYGMHRAGSALMTCFVRSYAGDHVHFVDGADGGYALAAKQLKEQLAVRERRAESSISR